MLNQSVIMLQEVEELWLPLPWWKTAEYKETFWAYFHSGLRLFIGRWVHGKDQESYTTNIVEYCGTNAKDLISGQSMTDEEVLTFIQEWYWSCCGKHLKYK